MQDADTVPFEPTPGGGPSVKVFADRKLCFSTELAGVLELGRQRQDEPPPFVTLPTAEGRRAIVAPLENRRVSRQHATLQLTYDGQVKCVNRSTSAEIRIDGGHTIPPGGEHTARAPLLFSMGDRLVRIEEPSPDPRLETLRRPTLPPGVIGSGPERFRDVIPASAEQEATDKLLAWLRSTMEVFQSAASAPDFLGRAVQAVVSIVDLDVGAIVEPAGDSWRVTQTAFADGRTQPDGWEPSRRMVDSVRNQKTTVRYQPNLRPFGAEASQPDIISMVASPILDSKGELLGVLYGEQRCQPGATPPAHEATLREEEDDGGIGELEATLVELLASGVAAGLARLEQEQAAVAARVRFEQFFTPDLARQLREDDHLLEGRDALVTILFCDIRGFSRITEAAGPEQTLRWVGDVMSELSECVVEQEGVLVDYQGDGLMAMWGAPVAHEDQAYRACRAGQLMLCKLPGLNGRWREILGRETRVSIGINTGVARVGNIGSMRKFKYGPLGNVVNLAARVQTATKHVGVDMMLTGQTAAALPEGAPIRRLCNAQVVNIKEPATFYEMPAEDTPEWRDIARRYEEALTLATEGQYRPAARALGNLVASHPDETPSLKLLARVVDAMTDPDRPYDEVWELREK
ncbi:MAG: adenylate/guanylate cyclase domain-containing protein [Planctomycetota bacterium]